MRAAGRGPCMHPTPLHTHTTQPPLLRPGPQNDGDDGGVAPRRRQQQRRRAARARRRGRAPRRRRRRGARGAALRRLHNAAGGGGGADEAGRRAQAGCACARRVPVCVPPPGVPGAHMRTPPRCSLHMYGPLPHQTGSNWRRRRRAASSASRSTARWGGGWTRGGSPALAAPCSRLLTPAHACSRLLTPAPAPTPTPHRPGVHAGGAPERAHAARAAVRLQRAGL